MPIYEYKCQKCEKEFEEFQRITDPPLSLCPFCNGPVIKLLSLSSFQLKGGGWYATEYGNHKPQSAENTKESKPEASSPVKEASSPGKEASSPGKEASSADKTKAAKPGSAETSP